MKAAIFFAYWSTANASVKRKYCRQYLELWCVATISGTVKEFEDEWGGEINAKQKRKMHGDYQAAVAASPATPVAAVSDDIEDSSRCEDLDNKEEFADDDPLAQLFECASDSSCCFNF